jgi:hypothetical protein
MKAVLVASTITISSEVHLHELTTLLKGILAILGEFFIKRKVCITSLFYVILPLLYRSTSGHPQEILRVAATSTRVVVEAALEVEVDEETKENLPKLCAEKVKFA